MNKNGIIAGCSTVGLVCYIINGDGQCDFSASPSSLDLGLGTRTRTFFQWNPGGRVSHWQRWKEDDGLSYRVDRVGMAGPGRANTGWLTGGRGLAWTWTAVTVSLLICGATLWPDTSDYFNLSRLWLPKDCAGSWPCPRGMVYLDNEESYWVWWDIVTHPANLQL